MERCNFTGVKRLIHILVLALTGFHASAQNDRVRTTIEALKGKPDSVIAQSLNDSSKFYRLIDFQLSYDFAQEGMEFAKKCGNKRMEGNSNNYSGIAQQLMGHYPEALSFYTKAENIFSKAGLKKGLASTYINIGVLSQDMGNTPNSILYNRKAYVLTLELGDSVNAASALNNIATLHSDLEQYDSALWYNFRSLEMRERLGISDAISTSLSNIGTIYDNTGRYEEAYRYHSRSVALDSATGNFKSLCISLSNLGSTLIHLGRNEEAKKVLLLALEKAKEIDYPDIQLDVMVNLIAVSEKLGDLQSLAQYSRDYVALKDSIVDRETREAYGEMQAKLDNTVQQHDIENLKKINALKDERVKKQQVIIWLSVLAGLVFLGFLVYFYRSNIQRKKANAIISEQKSEVEKQKVIVEEQNREIMDSINYAQRIQQALLMPEKDLAAFFSGAFVLFRAKAVVSGDFYWFAESAQNRIIALADCTGHGVPGGFMSMLGYEILQDVILREEVHTTSEALKILDRKVTETLNRNSRSYRDGMDMALLAFNRTTGKMQYSGANRPVIIVSNGKLNIIEPDKLTIGGDIEGTEKMFRSHEVEVHKGDMVYLFSDGYADQFGGPSGKKFKTKSLHEKLLSISSLSPLQQREDLERTFLEWKDILEQVDDVTIIGIRI